MWPFDLFWGWTDEAAVAVTPVRLNYPTSARTNAPAASRSQETGTRGKTNTPSNEP